MKVHEDAVLFPDWTEGIYVVVDKEDFVLISLDTMTGGSNSSSSIGIP